MRINMNNGDSLMGMRRKAAKSPPPPFAPRVNIRSVDRGQAIEPAPDAGMSGADFRDAFLGAFGTKDEIVAQALYEQLFNALHAASGEPVNNATADLALALMHEIGPKDVVEAMLACQMVLAHFASMDAARRTFHAEQTAGGRQVYTALARRLMMLYTAQMDALSRHRGKTTVQKVIVEKVLVAPGGQAIVGAVASGGRGDGG
jgi:hypothetical protein